MNAQPKKKSLVVPLLGLVIVLGGLLAWYVNRTPASTLSNDATPQPAPQALLQRGEYVARLGDCVACHTVADGRPFAGGLKMNTPLGAIYTTNITPDKTHGIGGWSLADFDRALRHGVARDGHRLYPAMPYPSYAKLNDDDVRALYAWFSQRVEPVNQPNRASEIPWPLNMRWPLALWNGLFTRTQPYQPKAGHDALWNRGAYLVQGPGHCGSCHTPRGLAFNEKGLDETSDQYLAGALLDGWVAPSLQGQANNGIGRWSEQDVVRFLKTGRNQHAVVFGSMADAFNNSTQFMSDDDLRAIAHYLKSLPAADGANPPAWRYDAASNQKLTLEQRSQHPGAATYMAKCSACHGADGRGQGEWVPPLAGSSASLAADPDSSINVTLNGSARIVAAGVPDAYRMPAFRQQLSDGEMADVLSFIRSEWGNNGGKVSAEQVKKLRDRTDPASSSVIILQMR